MLLYFTSRQVNEPYFGGDLTKLGKNASQQGVRPTSKNRGGGGWLKQGLFGSWHSGFVVVIYSPTKADKPIPTS